MRLAVISHACVVDVNQRLYAELAKLPDVELLLIAPRVWRASTGRVVRFRPLEGARYLARPLPVWGSGQITFHVYRGLARALREFRPTAVYLDEEPYSLAAAQILRLQRRLGFRLAFCQTQNLVKRYPWPFSRLERRMLDTCDLIIAITQECAEVAATKGARSPVAVVPLGVDTDRFRPRPELQAELGLTAPVVGYVGRLAPEKGLPDLRAAVDLLRAGGHDFSVLIVGDGPEREAMRTWAQAGAAGTVALAGSVPHSEVPRYLNVCDLTVLPARTRPGGKEQFGRTVIESLACAVPVVGSTCGEVPRLLAETGGGVVFPERDAEALSAAIRDMLLDPCGRKAMGERGREVVVREYSYPRVAQKLHAALREIAGA